jgi:hypothetical protein
LQAANWNADYFDQDEDFEEWEEDAQSAEPGIETNGFEPAALEHTGVDPDLITADDIVRALNEAPSRNAEPGGWTEIASDGDDPATSSLDDEEEDDEHYHDPDYDESAPRNRLSAILWGDDDIIPLEDELRALTRDMLDAPEMEQIDTAADTEQWLGWIVSATMRRSDCLIPMLVRHFDWKAKAAAINAPYYMDDIIARYRDLVRLTALRKSSHQDHPMYQRLCRAPSGGLGQVEILMHRSAMRRFVASVRADNPTIEWDFNPETLEMWGPHLLALGQTETKSSWGSWRIGLFALLFLSQLARLCSSGSDPVPPTAIPKTSIDDPALQNLIDEYEKVKDSRAKDELEKTDDTRANTEVLCRDDPLTNADSCEPVTPVSRLEPPASINRPKQPPGLPSAPPVKPDQ